MPEARVMHTPTREGIVMTAELLSDVISALADRVRWPREKRPGWCTLDGAPTRALRAASRCDARARRYAFCKEPVSVRSKAYGDGRPRCRVHSRRTLHKITSGYRRDNGIITASGSRQVTDNAWGELPIWGV